MNYYREGFKPNLEEYDIEFFHVSSENTAITAVAHVHSAVEILYICKGNYKIEVDGEQQYAKKDDIVLFASNAIHSVYHTENAPGQYYVLKLTPNILFRVFRGGACADCIEPFIKRQKNDKIIFRDSQVSDKTKALLGNMISEYSKNDKFMYAAQKFSAFELLLSLYRDFFDICEPKSPKELNVSREIRALIYESVEYINENYASDITPFECAKMINFSYSYYNKLFHEIIGKGFKEYLTGIRLAKAHNALVSTELSVTDIAMSYGYKSTAYFISEFKKVYGITPGAMRDLN